MAEVDFVELLTDMAALKTTVDKIDHDLYGNGRPGFISEVRDILSQGKGMLRLIAGIGILITLLLGVLTIRSFIYRTASINLPTSTLTHEQQKELSDAP